MICTRNAGLALQGAIKRLRLVSMRGMRVRREVKYLYCDQLKESISPLLMRNNFCFCSGTLLGEDTIALQNMLDTIREDIKDSYRSYTKIRQSLITHLAQQHYNRSNDDALIAVLTQLSHYPIFPLPKPSLLHIYKIICFNLHLKCVQTLNNLLLFILVADEQPAQSPIFHEFIKFYLQLTLQQFKFKYQLDFSNMSISQAIKQFLGKLVHRGFLPRTPPYYRNLNILYHEKTLNLLMRNESVRSTQMIKKINYSLFLDIKQFYQKQMKENLYHERKAELLTKFNGDYLRFLSEEVQMTHYEAIHLRQLYMKLYLTLPEKGGLVVYKYKNTIFMYWLGMKHIQRLDHLKLQEIKEKIDVVIEYVQQVKQNMLQLINFEEEELEALDLGYEEKLLIVECILQAGQSLQSCEKILNSVHQKTSPILFFHYFARFIAIFKHSGSSQAIINVLSDYKNYEWLKLPQLLGLIQSFTQNRPAQRSIVLGNVLNKVLSTNYQVIGGQEIIIFLNIYKAFIEIGDHPSQESAQALRKFQMRYIADHHTEFSLTQFQQIVILLSKLPASKCTHFDDADNNYPNTIFEQINPYFSKVSLLLNSQAKEAFQAIQKERYPN